MTRRWPKAQDPLQEQEKKSVNIQCMPRDTFTGGPLVVASDMGCVHKPKSKAGLKDTVVKGCLFSHFLGLKTETYHVT